MYVTEQFLFLIIHQKSEEDHAVKRVDGPDFRKKDRVYKSGWPIYQFALLVICEKVDCRSVQYCAGFIDCEQVYSVFKFTKKNEFLFESRSCFTPERGHHRARRCFLRCRSHCQRCAHLQYHRSCCRSVHWL